MTNINIDKIIARKAKKPLGKTREEIRDLFVEYIFTQIEALKKTFPTIIIPNDHSGRIIGLSYSSEVWTTGRAHMSDGTHNIQFSSVGNKIHVGYGANSAGGTRIPYEPTMNKTQLRKAFKQALETLVNGAYWSHDNYYKSEDKVCKVWYEGKVQ